MSCTVLIVDDNEALAENLAEVLECEGFEVHIATSGSEGIAVMRDLPEPRLLVTDINMPGMNGVELLRKLAAERPGTRAIVITAYAHDTLLAEARRQGAAAVLTKPLDLGRLTELCGEVCRTRT